MMPRSEGLNTVANNVERRSGAASPMQVWDTAEYVGSNEAHEPDQPRARS